MVLLYLKDGTTLAATDNWIADGKLHYRVSNGGERTLDMNDLDSQRTVDENAKRGVPFTFKPFQSNGDYGPGTSKGYPQWREESEYEEPNEKSRPMIIVYLQDGGSSYDALDYWLMNGTLHIETIDGTEKSFPLDQVDVQRTFAENTARGVTFTFFPFPSPSDPGPMLAPESYAPDCPSPSQASQPAVNALAARPPATTNDASWFGASIIWPNARMDAHPRTRAQKLPSGHQRRRPGGACLVRRS